MNMGAKGAGRVIGVLILARMPLGYLVSFVLQAPLFGAPGFLASAASLAIVKKYSNCSLPRTRCGKEWRRWQNYSPLTTHHPYGLIL
jgi:hypothetical protein